jgi:isopentenyl phosphate kinase
LRIVLGHGSGSFGHTVGQKYRIKEGLASGQSWVGFAETGAAAARLNRIVTDALLKTGVPVVSVQPSASARCSRGKLAQFDVYPIHQALRYGLVPLVYGDVAFDDEQGCTIVSTEGILSYLARQFRPDRIVLVGKVHGVYDGDPLKDPGARPVPRITPDTFEQIEPMPGDGLGIDVTGGMRSKVRDMVALVASNYTQRVHLISGMRNGALTRALVGTEPHDGTVIER